MIRKNLIYEWCFMSIQSEQIQEQLLAQFGHFIAVSKLWKILSYSSASAYRRARSRGETPFEEIEIVGRKGKFVPTIVVAEWLGSQVAPYYDQIEENYMN